MKIKGREFAVWDVAAEVKKRDSWVNLVNWEEVVPHMCFSTEYPKGTNTTSRTLSYAQSINSIAEQIHLSNKGRFKTISEVLRCALHIGIFALYRIFVHGNMDTKNASASFFFKTLDSMSQVMEIGQIVTHLDEKSRQLKEMVRKQAISKELAYESWKILYESVPEKYKNYVSDALLGDEFSSLRDSRSDIKALMQEVGKAIPTEGD